MTLIRQHFPNFCEGFEVHQDTVESVEDLERIKWIRSWRDNPGFYRFSMAPPTLGAQSALLMAEFHEGREWWVVAYLKDPIPGLPLWEKKV
jgi:hypothetical protein